MAVSETRKSQIIAFSFILLGIAITIGLSVANADAFKILAVFAVLIVTPLFILRPELGFLALIIARPFIDILSDQVNINFFDIVSINLRAVIGIILVAWGSLFLIYKRVRVFRIPVFYPLLALSLLSLLSITTSDYKIIVFGEWIRVSSFIVIFLLGYHFTHNLHKFRSLATSVVLSAILPLALGLYQLVTGAGISDEASSNRIFSTFEHPSLFGQYLAFIMIFLLVLIILFSRYSLMYGATYVVLGFLLLFTFSRGAWVFGAIGSTILAVIFYRQHLHRVFLFGLGVLFCIGTLGLLLQSYTSFKPLDASLVARVKQTTQFNPDSSVVWRFQFWQKSLSVAQPFLLRGYGAGTFLEFSEAEVNSGFEAHNDFLKLTVELGIFGCIALISFFVIILSQALRAYKKETSRDEKILAMFIVAEVTGMIFVSFFDNLYQNTTLYWVAFALFGGSLRLLENVRQRTKS